MSTTFMIQRISLCALLVVVSLPITSRAEIDFFKAPATARDSTSTNESTSRRGTKIAKILFFIAPGCSACPEEAAKLEAELNRIGLKYQIEGVFVGDPPQIGKYLAALRTYPFKFEIVLDMDGMMTKQYGVKTFPSAVIEIEGKKFVITKATDLEAKLK